MATGQTKSATTIRVNGFDHVPRPFLIGVGGGTASGKSSVCKKIMEQLGQNDIDDCKRQVIIVSQDCFYRELNKVEREKAFRGEFNFDHPDAFDDKLMYKTMQDIKDGKYVNIPAYDYKNHQRIQDKGQTVYPADVVLFEGILVFYYKELLEMFNMKLFVDTDSDTRLSRRVLRDMKERDRDLEVILHQYTTYVKPAFEDFCLPTKKFADVIIPRGADNTVAIDLIVQHIQELLRPRPESIPRRVRHQSDSIIQARPH
ncbi:unnamed protein product [Owenia fusiformis]|uniref:Uridine kinase n=1 Tax=Owenia fusiformis TaxID=6347 RepID=A0A8S4Q2K0_OWEFU|nr:unnamed protein product [Owenia fusiformis]